jgi:hypothetical protein
MVTVIVIFYAVGIIIRSERFGVLDSDRGVFNFLRWFSLIFFTMDFLPKDNLSKMDAVQSDRLCKFMDVRNQQCDPDLISILCFRCGSYLVFYFQGRVGWLVVGELLSLVTFPVFVGLFEWLGQVYLDIGVNAEFLLATRGLLNYLPLICVTVNIKTLFFPNGSGYIGERSAEAIIWCIRFLEILSVNKPTDSKYYVQPMGRFFVLELFLSQSSILNRKSNETPTPMAMLFPLVWKRQIWLVLWIVFGLRARLGRGFYALSMLKEFALIAGTRMNLSAQGIHCFLQAKPQEAYKKLLLFAEARSWLVAFKSLALDLFAMDSCLSQASF